MADSPASTSFRFTSARLVRATLQFRRRSQFLLALAVAAGTAVFTGALLVGDSVRGSLRHLTLDRLGHVNDALVGDRFFRVQLADELSAAADLPSSVDAIVPLMLIEGSASSSESGARASGITLLAINDSFEQLDRARDIPLPQAGEVVINAALAVELQVSAGQDILVRLPTPSDIPRDSPLGRKTDTIANRRVRVIHVVPNQGLGRFGLRPNQQEPLVAYLSLAELQDALEQEGRVNALLVTGKQPDDVPSEADEAALQAALRPKLADYGLNVHLTSRGYVNLWSDQMIIPPVAERAAMDALADRKPQPVLTYLANEIRVGPNGKARIPYSTIAALEPSDHAPLGPLPSIDGQMMKPLADDEIALNRWALDDFQEQGVTLKIGDPVTLTYFEPESTHGQVRERSQTLRLAAVVEMEGAAADRDLTPELKGVTDEESIANWDPPFPYDSKRVRSVAPHDQDDQYWKKYKATPKGFVSLATGRRLWASRFGQTTSIRVPPTTGFGAYHIGELWRPDPIAMGFEFQHVKRQGLAASAGTTPFQWLFIGFSMFIIGAAVALVTLVFKLGIELRAEELGVMRAVGLSHARVRRLLLAEGSVTAAIGSLLGTAAGVGYAWLMLVGLRTWWLEAVNTRELSLYVTPGSLITGFLAGAGLALAAIVWALRTLKRLTVHELLANQIEPTPRLQPRAGRMTRWVAIGTMVLGVTLGIAGIRLGGAAQAGAFFGAGALVLVALLAAIRAALASGRTGPLVAAGGLPLLRLAVRNSSRNAGRSALTVGLVAAASFLIVAVSSFQLSTPDPSNLATGTGGLALVAQCDVPIFQDVNQPDVREDLAFSTADDKLLRNATVYSLRLKSGDDSSCRNLYQTTKPALLGFSRSLIQRGGFFWAATAAATEAERNNPWLLLQRDDSKLAANAPSLGSAERPIPAVIDFATAVYGLHLSGRPGERYVMPDGRGGTLHLEIVGLLSNSIFQGMLLVNEADLLTAFPELSGFRFFLIDAPPEDAPRLEQALELRLGEFGFTTEPSGQRLAGFLAVQNTYLATFQTLGGLGLLLGTVGVAVVQLRNVLERRGELALLRAAGFRRARLAELVMLENGVLLLAGLGVGILAAAVAIAPHLGAEASVPWRQLGFTLALVLAAGLLGGLFAVRAALNAPLLATLKGE